MSSNLTPISFLAAVLIDRIAGEPPAAVHPVVWMGKVLDWLRARAPQDPAQQLLYGAGIALAPPAVYAAGTWLVLRTLDRVHPLLRLVAETAILKSTFAARDLFRSAEQVEAALDNDRLDHARKALMSLVSRDTSTLGSELLAAAAIESVAENASDSFVGPMVAALTFGAPGAVAYRAINTADSTIGYRGVFEYLGKVAARLDDLVNLVPARLTGWLIVAGAALAEGNPLDARSIMLRDHDKTESPNAGWPMSAMAGALGIRLEKVGHYQLGDPERLIEPADIGRAIGIVRTSLTLATLGFALLGGVLGVARTARRAR